MSLQFCPNVEEEEESVRYLRGGISGQMLLYQQKRSCKQPSAKEKKKKKKTYRAAHITEDTAEETQTHTHIHS